MNLNDLKMELNFKNPQIIEKGNFVSRLIGKSKTDIYIYEKSFDNMDNNFENLSSFLDELIKRKKILTEYSKAQEVTLRLFTQSSQAQIYFKINNDIISKLNELQIPIELSVFSWGEV